jgi:hypothetical protein
MQELATAGILDLVPDGSMEGKKIEAIHSEAKKLLLPSVEAQDHTLEIAAALAIGMLFILGLVLTKNAAPCLVFGFFIIQPGLIKRFFQGLKARFFKALPIQSPQEKILALLEELQSHAILRPMGPVILEVIPTRRWLIERKKSVQQSLKNLLVKKQEFSTTLDRIEELNLSLGRNKEDEETSLLKKKITELQGSIERLLALEQQLYRKEAELEARLGTLRLQCERQSLSLEVDRLSETGVSKALLAGIEAELAMLPDMLAPLEAELQNESLRLSAMLEVNKAAG